MSRTSVSMLAGTPAWFPGPSRRGIDPSDLRYAREKREIGWGWQAIANILKINVLDLRSACGDLKAAAQPEAEPAPDASAAAASAEGLLRDQVLAAVNRGFTKTTEIAELIRRPTSYTATVLSQLKAGGYVAGNAYSGRTITDRGRERLRQAGMAARA